MSKFGLISERQIEQKIELLFYISNKVRRLSNIESLLHMIINLNMFAKYIFKKSVTLQN